MGLNTTLKLKTPPTRVMLSQTYLLMETTKVQQVGSYTLHRDGGRQKGHK